MNKIPFYNSDLPQQITETAKNILEGFLDKKEEYDYPSYKDKGHIIIQSYGKSEPYSNGSPNVYKHDIEVLDHTGCAFWIQEGEGFDYWFDCHFDNELDEPGFYIVENITGFYIRGDWGFTDDDVDWDFDPIRKISEDEVKHLL